MITLLFALSALAQDPVQGGDVPAINGQIFRPALDSTGLLWTSETQVAREDPLTGRFLMSYVNDPVVYIDGADRRTELVSSIWQLDLIGAWSYKRLRIGVDAPVYLRSTSEVLGGETGLGDLALDLRGTLLDRQAAPLGLALAGRITLPTTTVDGALGNRGLGWEWEAIADKQLTEHLLLAANLGTKGVPGVELENLAYNDQIVARLGGAYSLSDRSGLGLELIRNMTLGALSNPAGNPTEAMLGGWHVVDDAWRVRGGVGRGITTGIGASKLRVVAALAYEPPLGQRVPPVLDTDGDGLFDDVDACVGEAEDADGVADQDGCPEPTLVTVRVVDADSKPVEGARYILDGEAGEAGETVERFGGFYKLGGTAPGYLEADAVSVQIPDAETAELVVQLTPVPPALGSLTVAAVDSAGAGVEGATWAAVGREGGGAAGQTAELEPGEWVISVTAPGYKEVRRTLQITSDTEEVVRLTLEPSKVVVTAERIDLKDSVYFETGKAVIKVESNAMLDEIAELMVNHPELLKVKVEGHTDSRGNAAYNKDLSARRAAAVVDYLVGRGVERGRLSSEGFGEERPIDPANNAAAWEKNRRVDFFVLERAD